MSRSGILSAFISVLVGLLTVLIMGSPYKYPFAVLMALITYVLMNFGAKDNAYIGIKLPKAILGTRVLNAIWIVFLITAFSLGSTYMRGEFVNWGEIPPLNLLRALAFYPLVFFYPGYGLVNLLTGGRRRIEGFELFVISLGTSLFLSGTIALLVWLVTGSVSTSSSYLVILFNALLLVLTLVRRRSALGKGVMNKEAGLDLFTLGIVGGAVFFTALGTYAGNLPDYFTYGYDTWAHYGTIHRIVTGVPESVGYNYPIFMLYNALYVATSGIPFINAYQLTFFLASLHVLAFYLICSTVLSRRQAALATLIYSTFSGLGGLYSIFLRAAWQTDFWSAIGLSAGRCYDLEVGVQAFSYFYMPIQLTYSFLFIFLHLALSKEYPRFARVTLMMLSFATGFLTELTVIPFLVAVVFFLILFNVKMVDRPIDVSLSQFLGLVISFGILNVFASRIAVSIENLSPLFRFFPYLMVATMVTLVLSCLKVKVLETRKSFNAIHVRWTRIQEKAAIITSIACIYLLLTLFNFWLFIPSNLANYRLFGGMVPWYFYPVKLGLPIFIAVIMIPSIVKKGDLHVLKLGAIIILTSFFAGNATSYILENNLAYIPHNENRWLIYSWGGISILASYGLLKILQTIKGQLKFTKKIVFAALLVFILIGGISGTLLSIELQWSYTNNIKMAKDEVDAYYNLSHIIDRQGVVAAPSYKTQNKISFYAARTYLDEAWHDYFFSSIYPDFLPAVFSNNPYAASASKEPHQWYVVKPLNEPVLPHGLVFDYLANYLPILDENKWFVLYGFPAMSPSTPLSDTAFVPSFTLKEEEQRLRIIADENQTEFWNIALQHAGQYALQIEESKEEKARGETSLLVNVTRGAYQRVAISHSYKEPQDWSGYDSLSLFWYGTGSVQQSIAVIIYAPDSYNQLWLEWDDVFVGWRKLKADLSNMPQLGKPDLKNVTSVEVRFFPQLVNTYYLDSLALEREVSPVLQVYTETELALQFSLSMSYTNYTVLSTLDPLTTSPSIKTMLTAWDPENPPDNLLSWIEEGGTLVIFQGEPLNRTGFFGQALKLTGYEQYVMADGLSGPRGETRLPMVIQSNAVSSGADEVTPLAWYTRYGNPVTPYALLKNLGEGRIVYVIATPYIEALSKSATTEEGHALFSHLTKFMEVLGLPLDKYREPPPSVYAFIIGSVILSDGEIEARTLLPLEAGMPRESINIRSTDILVGGSRLSNITLSEWKIEDLEKAQITFNQALIYPTHISSYAKVQLTGSFNLTLTPRQGTNILMQVDNGTVTSTISTQDIVTLEVHGDEQEKTEFYLKGAEFNVASAQFEKMLFDFFSGINDPGLPLSVNGGMKFKIQNVDENFVLITDVVISGKYNVLASQATIRESRWYFPSEALLSPFFWLLTYITGEQIIRVARKHKNCAHN